MLMMKIINAYVRLIAYNSTPSQHVIRKFAILAVQDCIINGNYSTSGKGYEVSFTDVRERLATYAPNMLCSIKGVNNHYCYAQALSWNHSPTKSLDQRCTEYDTSSQSTKSSLEKYWVNVFDRSVIRNRVMNGLFSQRNDSFFVDEDMKRCLDTLRVYVRTDLVSRIASKMIAWSANFLGKSGPSAANMGSETIATGVVWNALGLGKSASRSTSFAKKIITLHTQSALTCVYCNTALNSRLHMDHVMSFHHGGYSCHHGGNLVPSCATCNGSNGKGAKYLGDEAWICVQEFYQKNPAVTIALKHSMTNTSSRRQIQWRDWWDEIIGFYSDHLEGTVVWNPGKPLTQLTKLDLDEIRRILNVIKQL
jgi:hypothetical protein